MQRLLAELLMLFLVVCGFLIIVEAVFPRNRRAVAAVARFAARRVGIFGVWVGRTIWRVFLFVYRGFAEALELFGWFLERLCTLVAAWITSLHNALVLRWPRATRIGYGVFLVMTIMLLITSFT